MPLVTSTQLLIQASEEGYAVGAFNANNMEVLQAIVEAAEEERAPVIVMVSEGAIAYAGLEFLAAMATTAARLATVPVVLQLDHGTSLAQNIRCLQAGFTALMFDGSSMPISENISISARIAEAAHACGIPVESELGKIPKIEDYEHLLPAGYDYSSRLPQEIQDEVTKLMADPDQAEEFVARTQCDSLAVAVGSVHGMRNDVQPLDIQRLAAIRERTGVPLVLHGASGVIRSREDAEHMGISLAAHEGTLQDAIAHGVAKINVGTEISRSFLRGIRAAQDADPGQKDLRKILFPAKREVKETVRSYLRLFGCCGKANVAAGAKGLRESEIRHHE